MSKYLIIDSSYLTYRSYFAYPELKNVSGQNTNALYGFSKSVMTLVSKLNPDYVVFTKDTQDKTFRHDLDSEYKANRNPMEDNLVSQLPLIDAFQKGLSDNVFAVSGYEADDIIYSVVAQNQSPENIFYILSGDKDLYQLFTFDNVYIVSMEKEYVILFGRSEFELKYELRAEQWVDFKALCGDGSDNFKGVEGIGKVGAVKLLQNCRNLYTLVSLLNLETDAYDPISFCQEQQCQDFVNNSKNQSLLNKIRNNPQSLAHCYQLSKLVTFDYLKGKVLNKELKWNQVLPVLENNQMNSLVKSYYKNFGSNLEQDTLF